MQHLTQFWQQETIDHKPANQEPKTIGSSFYRGETCNFNPYIADLNRLDFLKQFILKGWLPPSRFIDRSTQITAFGSCFAGHITNHLQSIGFSLSRERNPGIYISAIGEGLVNVHTLAQQFEWALENRSPPEGLWHGFRCEEFGYDEAIRLRTREAFLTTELFILTFGLSEIWFDEPTGGVFWRAVPMEKYDASRHKFRVCSYAETKQQIERIHELIRKHVPNARILFTLSPIPLIATFRPIGALTASSALKSIIRAALDEFIRDHADELNDRLFYFPSYEIMNELFPSRYVPDGTHPHVFIIDFIMKLFESVYCDTETTFEEVAELCRKARAESARIAVEQTVTV